MKLLFITRKFPPSIGGMETLSAALANEFPKLVDTSVIAWGGSQIYLPFFVTFTFIKCLYLIPSKKITHIHLGDALLSPVGLVLKRIFGVKCSVSAHGLDITFKPKVYQKIISYSLPKLDKVICVSKATMNECLKRGVPKEKCAVIPNGIYPDNYRVNASLNELENIAGLTLKGKKVLVTVGRLIPRKGVYWFVKNILPKLGDNYIYLIVGDGPEKKRIEDLIYEMGLERRAIMLGKISNKKLKIVYNTSDAMIMPNIKVKHDMEGFGIVALEANSAGLPVIASATEGIKDVVVDGKNGYLLNGDLKAWPKKITSVANGNGINKTKMAQWVGAKYHWQKISEIYLKSFGRTK
jgi:glycosyltransferase involved in cell wall biosynthesis